MDEQSSASRRTSWGGGPTVRGEQSGRRRFLRICGLVTAGALGTPAMALATRIRVLGEAGDQERVIGIGQKIPEFGRFVDGVRVGEARQHGSLVVLWLHGTETVALPVATLDEAREHGTLVITERAQATVPELI